MHKISILPASLALLLALPVSAKVDEAQAARLGQELTPVGAERAANADGSIPAWQGGISQPPAGYKVGMHHADPFAADQPLLVISKDNLEQHKALLSPGQLALFAAYPESFRMPVYPTRRSASYPQAYYDATRANATRAQLADGGNGFTGAVLGVPFPIPANGLEAIWNHLTRYRGEGVRRWGGQAAVTTSGEFTYVRLDERLRLIYATAGMTPEQLAAGNVLFKFKQQVTQPARLAGTALLVHETLNQVKEPRQAWTYNTGQRRVRRAPNVAYDAPGTAADGLRTTDDYDMFNGSPDRYEWTLKGKQELLIPYNSYKLHSDALKNEDILQPGHINPDLTRYEKHRVWVVEATLKAGVNHTYKTRRFYLDEDSWQISMAELYDNRDQLYRVAMAHAINYYEVPTLWSTLEVFHDLQARRYIAIGLDNQEKMYEFTNELSDEEFSPNSLRQEGRR